MKKTFKMLEEDYEGLVETSYTADKRIEWLNLLLDYAYGKVWDTGQVWVCEAHPKLPFEMGYAFDCQCGAPGMCPPNVKLSDVYLKNVAAETLRPFDEWKKNFGRGI